ERHVEVTKREFPIDARLAGAGWPPFQGAPPRFAAAKLEVELTKRELLDLAAVDLHAPEERRLVADVLHKALVGALQLAGVELDEPVSVPLGIGERASRRRRNVVNVEHFDARRRRPGQRRQRRDPAIEA